MILKTLPAFVLVAFAHANPETVAALRAWAALPHESRPAIDTQPFAAHALSKAEAGEATEVLWGVRSADLKREREKEWAAKSIVLGDKTMKFEYKVFGDKPKGGRSLFISMHGGGGAPAAVNEQQWRNQIGLYTPKEGVYLAPRAPTDTWNLWHEGHIDDFFDRIIAGAVVFEGVDPNRVYLMGYSAGGDGVYQLAPRMADRFAAASMMAGHPNDAAPDNLRNLPFAIHMGENDGAYNRNAIAKQWGEKLDALAKAAAKAPAQSPAEALAESPAAYTHIVELHKGKGHWMDREDASAVGWMAGFTRNPWPKRVVWLQSSRVHTSFAWLAVDSKVAAPGQRIDAAVEGQNITITRSSPSFPIQLFLNDALIDLDRPVRVMENGAVVSDAVTTRSIAVIWKSLVDKNDPTSSATNSVLIPGAK